MINRLAQSSDPPSVTRRQGTEGQRDNVWFTVHSGKIHITQALTWGLRVQCTVHLGTKLGKTVNNQLMINKPLQGMAPAPLPPPLVSWMHSLWLSLWLSQALSLAPSWALSWALSWILSWILSSAFSQGQGDYLEHFLGLSLLRVPLSKTSYACTTS